jgi:hypothetical protein
MKRTVSEIRKRNDWPNMKREIKEYVKKCQSCQVNKTLEARHKVPTEITTTARRPFERCSIDMVGSTTEKSKENRYIITFQDDLIKFAVAEFVRSIIITIWST